MDAVSHVRLLTGITPDQVSDLDLSDLVEAHGGLVYCAAADAADRVALSSMGSGAVTSVEDITVDHRRPVQMWQGLADRLRARCEQDQAEAWDDGPAVVEFHPWGSAGREAAEHG